MFWPKRLYIMSSTALEQEKVGHCINLLSIYLKKNSCTSIDAHKENPWHNKKSKNVSLFYFLSVVPNATNGSITSDNNTRSPFTDCLKTSCPETKSISQLTSSAHLSFVCWSSGFGLIVGQVQTSWHPFPGDPKPKPSSHSAVLHSVFQPACVVLQ